MKAFIDHQLLKNINEKHFIESCRNKIIISSDEQIEVLLDWFSLLEYIDLGSLLTTFPNFDEKNIIFTCLTSSANLSKDVVIRLFDQIFIQCLTQVKDLPEINPSFLLQKIKQKQRTPLFFSSLNRYEELLTKDPSHTIHDLILYLAFDRVCVCIAFLFEQISSQVDRLETLKECLIESFQHIKQDGKTSPGFFRFIEALYAYLMREEKLQSYLDSEWNILCQISTALQPREALLDLFYIDSAIIKNQEEEKNTVKAFTLESKNSVTSKINFSLYMIKKLQLEVPGWNYIFSPSEIYYIQKKENGYSIES
ncbi:MAG: hypothetical protein JSS09_09335 [Verrucomicrobia bacterium]|nr:hypothetical protein [Verrucomicrobiota bacterium]